MESTRDICYTHILYIRYRPILLYYILIEQSFKELFFARPENFGAKTAAKVEQIFHIRKYFAKKAYFLCFLAYLCNAKVANEGG